LREDSDFLAARPTFRRAAGVSLLLDLVRPTN
jgi:hypothetical protein